MYALTDVRTMSISKLYIYVANRCSSQVSLEAMVIELNILNIYGSQVILN